MDLEVTAIIISVLWMTLSLLAMIECAPYCKDLPKADQWTVGLILLIGGPILTIASVL